MALTCIVCEEKRVVVCKPSRPRIINTRLGPVHASSLLQGSWFMQFVDAQLEQEARIL